MKMKRTIGAFEKISFPDFGVHDVIAKIDTGATSGAVHATRIKELTLETNEKAVSFHPFGGAEKVTATGFTITTVTNSMGYSERRYVIPTTVVIEGIQYPINISLANRSRMKKKVLIGRKFLREHGFIVDTIKGTQYRSEVG
jgi:hypothetical protein